MSTPRKSAGYVTKVASYKALKPIAWGKLTFDKRVVLQRVVGFMVWGWKKTFPVQGAGFGRSDPYMKSREGNPSAKNPVGLTYSRHSQVGTLFSR